MRDNGTADAEVESGHDTFADLAREALNRLVSERMSQTAQVRREHLDHFMLALAPAAGFDAGRVLEEMARRHVDATAIASLYVPAAARLLGEEWAGDRISFIDVTLRTERLHELLRRVEDMLDLAAPGPASGITVLVLVAEDEQHTLGACVLAQQLRAAGFGVLVRLAPSAGELTQLLAANRIELALVSLGCTAALKSGVALVRTLRLVSRGALRVFVGGSIPLSDDRLLQETGADRVLRDVYGLIAEYGGCKEDLTLDRSEHATLKLRRVPAGKGDGVGSSR